MASDMTSVILGGVEIEDSDNYAVAMDTRIALEAATTLEPRLQQMAGIRPPVLTGYHVNAREIPMNVMLLNKSATTRLALFEALKAATSTRTDLVVLDWTISGVTRRLLVAVATGFTGTPFYHRCSARLTAPNPDPVTI